MFKTTIKRIAVQIGVLIFYGMSVIGWVCGLSPQTCCLRALLGAFAGYLLVRYAGQLVVRVLVSAWVDDQLQRHQQQDRGY